MTTTATRTLQVTPPDKRSTRIGSPGIASRARAAAIVLFGIVVLTPSAAWAQIDNPAPDASAPGAAVVTQVLGWLKWAGLAAALAGLLIGSISVGVGHFGQHGGAAQSGRKWILGGMGAAVLSGLAWTITTTLYNATA